ncbi:TIM-barrel domain-containing protein [Phytoactinopolyspora halophila]|nr:TIM-barrel domain-containing protein [Phytoactinopolyspora halophila]
MPDPSTSILRQVTGVRSGESDVELSIAARPAGTVGRMPGYLTGESLAEQGIETTLPNLPELELPPADPHPYAVRISWVAPDTVRITVAPPGAGVLADDGTWLGVVTDPGAANVPVTVADTGRAVVVESAALRVSIDRERFALRLDDVATGAEILRTAERLRQAAGLPVAPPVLANRDGITLNLELGPGEDILGFGEQFGRLVKNGQRLVLRCEDALGTGTGLAYKPVPVWHSSAGYTGFVNTGAVVTADVGHSMPSVFGLTVADDALDLYVVGGGGPRERLRSYTALTGRATVPPLWAFGYWMGRCRYHSREEMLDVASRARELGVPLDVLHCDPDWLVVDRLNCDFIWNEERFGNRRQFVEDLAALHTRLSVWELPYLDPASPRFAEAESKGYLVRRADGELAEIDKTPAPDGRPRMLVDFTNPDAVAWWQEMHEEFLADGVAVFKTDFGEGLPDGTTPHGGLPGHHAHNLYPLYYNGAVWDAVARTTGRSALVWGRSGWAGSQRYPGQWGGDAESTVAGMQATLRGGLSYAMSAPGFWSHDIGGFYGPELTPELYVRWTQFGAMSPLMRAHGLRPREPWRFGDRALEICRRWIRLRYELLPYLWQVAHESARNGWPVLRPLAFEYPDDPVAAGIDGQFMLGSELLVVPVFDDGDPAVRRRFYVPAGRWTDVLTDETVEGPAFLTREVPLERIPVLARDGAILPRVPVDGHVRRTDDLIGRPWTLHVYGDGDVADRELTGFDGHSTRVTVSGGTVTAEGSQPVSGRARRSGMSS